MADQATVDLAKKFVAHIANEDGELLANVYENEGFKSIFDAHGVNERKLRLPRILLQTFNSYNADK